MDTGTITGACTVTSDETDPKSNTDSGTYPDNVSDTGSAVEFFSTELSVCEDKFWIGWQLPNESLLTK